MRTSFKLGLVMCVMSLLVIPAYATEPVRIVEIQRVQNHCQPQQVQLIQQYVQPVVQRVRVQQVVEPVYVQRVQQIQKVQHVQQIQRIQRVQVQRIQGHGRQSITVRQPGLLGRILGRGSVVQIRNR